jgi:hypothetical protein
MEKAIFRNSAVVAACISEASPATVLDYFHLDVPRGPLVTEHASYPIVKDVMTHLSVWRMMDRDRWQRFTRGDPRDHDICRLMAGVMADFAHL